VEWGSQVKVTYTNQDFGMDMDEEFDTVILAVGRSACTDDLGLASAGLALEKSGKLNAVNEQTNVENIFAVGDVLESRQELTPVAIQAGKLLAQRLFGQGTKTMDYNGVPTTVSLDYHACALRC
jgi:pyruvate/2-oxoglutarate dehydrogenase complex dihydrolipoamide dehydrogenase (E3) component